MTNVVPLRKPRKPDPHGEMLDRAIAIDPYWTKARLSEIDHACRVLEDDLHIECAGDPDFNSRIRETW